jgi:hypothetical protein
MAKRIEKDGKFYRMRRGKLVEIPEEWLGKDQYKQSIRKRKSTKAWRRVAGWLSAKRRALDHARERAARQEE